MIETIKYAEYEWFLWLNSFHSPTFDVIMFWVTYRFTWLPLYVYVIYYIYIKFRTTFWQNLIFIAFSVGLSDRFTSGFMKPYFQRFRPCHDPLIQQMVHVVGDCGGQFGFASSHAANCFALAASFYLLNRGGKLTIFLFIWAIIVSYSRIYVGVHFPTDLIVGAIIGVLISMMLFILKNSLNRKFLINF
ncbi:phosphatase PAP2 family protein [Emticicia sp. SJ17W-69]|uniref:phosphatase PAP2 family protein n=1 Tax=Emticicia sp. SJ17W-69 TaxID=3421657 RepID=UPI003EBAA18D